LFHREALPSTHRVIAVESIDSNGSQAPLTVHQENIMNVSKLVSVLAFAALTAPLAAHADAPSGDFDAIFKSEQSVKTDQPQFPRSEYSGYVEHWLEDSLAANAKVAKTREQVRQEIAAMPLEVIGA
jgi:hypothetical protein